MAHHDADRFRMPAVMAVAVIILSVSDGRADEPAARFPVSSASQAWHRLPLEVPPLPEWACVLAVTLPRSTGALMLLDARHRGSNPIGNQLAGQLRWIAADAVGCDYGRAYAESDLVRTGMAPHDIHQLRHPGEGSSPIWKATVRFAEKMTLAAYTVTDEEVAELVEHYGPAQVVGMVHTLAFANFQNRLFLGLGVKVGEDGPVPPREWPLDLDNGTAATPPVRPTHEELLAANSTADAPFSIDWTDQSFATLNSARQQQTQRTGRVPIPGEEALAFLPPEQQKRSGKIIWSRVSLSYQPELTQGWFALMDAFREESQLDRVFSNTMFWVVTRSNECFY